MPLHPLFVHAAVMLLPIAACFAAAYVLSPSRRWWLWWPTAVLDVAALGALFLTRQTGESLMATITENKDLVKLHDTCAGVLTGGFLVLVVCSAFGLWAFPVVSPLAGVRGREARQQGFHLPVTILTVVAAVVVLAATVATGHTGAQAVWAK